MAINPKAVFLDMDGTILNHTNEVSIDTKEIIDELRSAGIFVFVATGRSADELAEMLPEGFAVDGIITANGMAGYIGEEVVFEHVLPIELVKTIITKARERKIYYELFPHGQARLVLNQDKGFVEAAVRDPKPDSVQINEWISRQKAIEEEIEWTDEITGTHFSKFYFFARTRDEINDWKVELEMLQENMEFTMTPSSPHNAEVMVAGVSKASGIEQMLKRFDLIGCETLAIGDSDNDIKMFDYVSHAVAMKNAADHIKDVVDEVTEFSCDENGVYHYLRTKVCSGIDMKVSRV
ncbi:haloacid dehalogenase-like hydrolase [Planococcus antarcticus DSM 14505]|uniref:HAD family hydrolase n=1 Tax=Planococcus antarcticus DSM 14505 TaxID=1185653 RepID=A0A1C7DD70_9BACL|nr:Cof-type HAD-IIB family hydrolase [Planococcus antarcticus]ANU09436.1 HAD family hydrolase [Planococcus antarcticus DSM 14505]EIM06066.1 haloacid dehalogenase-like hydrolase [Planococcus antarcticus DSM 14505]